MAVVTNLRKTEFTYNPEVIFQSEFDSDLLEFNGIGIGQDLSLLPTESVSEFYDKEDKSQNTDIKNGWILTKNGIQYVLKNGIVKMIRVKENGITKLNGFDKDYVEKLIGKPNRISNDSITWVWDNVVYAKVHHYKKRKIKIHFSTENGKVCELEIE
ncbi:hypothetical protein D2V08_01400 [Flagellimonas lutimaris]|uniref:Uncharacterized protein n=1 Tax=Flagellimonas lutimaris TaxID=475082 RepID=A0A3A1NAZ3_9FLAO|nr:hypothetical protein D2V08_01400 [Allomuricauda lutimaris]